MRREAGESEGGISSERLSNISGLFERGELGVLTFALSRPSGCSQVMQSPHTYSEGGRQCHSLGKQTSRRIVRGCT